MIRFHGDIRAIFALLLATIAVCACDCGSPKGLATLIERSGDVLRDDARAGGKWAAAAVGVAFQLGDAVWMRGAGTAVLELRGGQKLAMRPDSIIRFATSTDASDFLIEAGEAVLSVGDLPYELRTEFGTALIQPHSRLLLSRSGENQLYAVELGSAKFSGGGDAIMALVGNAVLMSASGPQLIEVGNAKIAGADSAQPKVGDDGAYLIEISDKGATLKATGSSEWKALDKGTHHSDVGGVLRLEKGARASVKRGSETLLLTGAGEFVLGGDSQAELTAAQGSLRILTSEKPVHLRVPGGSILVDAPEGGTEATVRIEQAGTQVAVAQGLARLTYGDEEVVLEEGMSGIIPGALTAAQREALGTVGPERADMRVPAGESFVVHTTSVPVVVGISAKGKCHSGAVVKLSQGSRIRGGDRVNVSFGAGRHAYGLYCIEGTRLGKRRVENGVVTVLRDSGTRQLPKTAPDAIVDTDGRRYTVIYQNQPPQVTVSWPGAPSAKAYVLHVAGGRTDQRLKGKQPRQDLASGVLADGVYQLVFETELGKRSPRTALEVRFDNAASTASVGSPQEKGFSVGDKVSVGGFALPGWKVAVEGGTLEIDRQRRFSGEVQTSEEHPNVAIRLSHARRGVHYYLRRAASP